MDRQNKYLITIITVIAVSAVLASGWLYNSYGQEVFVDWNQQELVHFSHSQTNFTFTFSGDERDDNGNFTKMINRVNSKFPDILFNINGGDLRYDPSQLDDFKKNYLTPGSTAHFNKPVLFALGNHDIEGPTIFIYQSIFGNPAYYYNFTENNSYFIVLNNVNGELDAEQMEWLRNQLKISQNYKYRFVFMHIPLYNPHGQVEENSMTKTGPGGADTLRNLFDASNVTMIFASHIHNYYSGTWGKTPYIISGGAGAPPENNQPPNHHYIIINVTDKGITYTPVPY